MAQETKEATVIASGKPTVVYKSKVEDVWIEYPNCTKKYKPSELKFK